MPYKRTNLSINIQKGVRFVSILQLLCTINLIIILHIHLINLTNKYLGFQIILYNLIENGVDPDEMLHMQRLT